MEKNRRVLNTAHFPRYEWGVTMLKKILDMFFNNKTNNLKKDYQGQPKTTINQSGDVLHNEIGPANPVSGAFDVIVTGVSFYQKALEKTCGGRSVEGIEVITQAKIIPYDDNPYDAYAVRIEIKGEIVGHLSRKDARKWRSKMISECFSGAVTCPARIVWDKGADKAGSYGVWLDTDLTLSDSKSERNSALAYQFPPISRTTLNSLSTSSTGSSYRIVEWAMLLIFGLQMKQGNIHL